MSYELTHNTSRRAPKLTSPAISKAYRKPPKEDKRMSDKTATERLRELLDERGVEWDTFSVGNTEYTHWTNRDGRWCAASIGGPQSLHVNILSATPEQAIAATLGNDGVTTEYQRSNDGVDVTCVPDDYTAKLMAEVARLEAKSDGLLKELEAEHALAETLGHYHEHAQAENDKLRELCKLAFTCIEQGEDEYGTDWSCAGCEFCDKCDGLIQARATAHELGIEV